MNVTWYFAGRDKQDHRRDSTAHPNTGADLGFSRTSYVIAKLPRKQTSATNRMESVHLEEIIQPINPPHLPMNSVPAVTKPAGSLSIFQELNSGMEKSNLSANFVSMAAFGDIAFIKIGFIVKLTRRITNYLLLIHLGKIKKYYLNVSKIMRV